MALNKLRIRKTRDPSYIFLIDELLSIYEAKMVNVAFHVKLRPFLADFLKKLYDDNKFEVHYYTAGTRSYGLMIIDIFIMEMKRIFGQTHPQMIQNMKHIVSHDRLIGRDDQKRFESNKGISSEEKMQEEYEKMIF